MIETEATKLTTPVDWFNVHVPSPVTVTDVPHRVVTGSTMHVAPVPEVTRPVPVARPDEPVIVVNITVLPGRTIWVSGVA